MNLRLAAMAMLLAGAPASATKAHWTGIGWYVLAYGEVSDDATGWLALTAGPYPTEPVCKTEAERRNSNKDDYMVLYSCRHLHKPPRPNKAGGISIWVE